MSPEQGQLDKHKLLAYKDTGRLGAWQGRSGPAGLRCGAARAGAQRAGELGSFWVRFRRRSRFLGEKRRKLGSFCKKGPHRSDEGLWIIDDLREDSHRVARTADRVLREASKLRIKSQMTEAGGAVGRLGFCSLFMAVV